MAPGVCDNQLSRFTWSKTISPSATTRCISFSDDGQYMYLGFRAIELVNSYQTTGSNWEIDDQSLFGTFHVDTEFEDSWGIAVKPDGSELYVSGNTGIVNGSIVSWDLPTPYLFDDDAPDTPIRIGSYGIGSILGILRINDINIKPDGTRLLGWGDDTGQNLYELDMSAWDIDSMVYNSVKSSQSATSGFVPKSGECMFKSNGSTVEQYSFGTAWDTSTLGATLIDSLDFSGLGSGPTFTSIEGLYVTNDRLFLISNAGDVHQYNA